MTAPLTPPPEICGSLRNAPREVVARRAAWVASLPAGVPARDIALALGIHIATVYSLRSRGARRAAASAQRKSVAIIPAAASRASNRPASPSISLPRLPWESEVAVHDPRPETHPRYTMVKLSQRPAATGAQLVATVKRAIAEVREESSHAR